MNFQFMDRLRRLKDQQFLSEYDYNRPVEFKAFYWLNWVQLAFIAILYWWAAINLDFWMQQNINTTFLLSVVLLRYVPSIMLICAYMILYF